MIVGVACSSYSNVEGSIGCNKGGQRKKGNVERGVRAWVTRLLLGVEGRVGGERRE